MEYFEIQEMLIVSDGVIIKDKDNEAMLVYWYILEQHKRNEF